MLGAIGRAIARSGYVVRQLHTHFNVMIVMQKPMRQTAVIAGLLTMGMSDLRDWKLGGLKSGGMRSKCQQQHRQGDCHA
ncbi:MAG: hypothetical protein EKK31_06500 [Hyphomicrobiales bacterium]|nr:MAG: hypothetical protein EKK31_06500 [Hyphomicrobiales bacterium]